MVRTFSDLRLTPAMHDAIAEDLLQMFDGWSMHDLKSLRDKLARLAGPAHDETC